MEDVGEIRHEEGDLLGGVGCRRVGARFRRRGLDIGAELGVEPGGGFGLFHRPVGDVVGLVELLLGRLRGHGQLAGRDIHDKVDAAATGLDGREAHGELEGAVRVVDLLVLDLIEVDAADDLGEGLAVVRLAAAGLSEARHGADGEVGGLGVDQVDLGVLGDEVLDDLLGGIGALGGVEAAEVLGSRVDGEDALDEGVSAAGLDLDVVGPAQLDHDDGLVGVGRLPLRGHLSAHGEGDASLVAAGDGDATVAERAEEGGHDDALFEGFLDGGLDGLVVPDVEGGGIHALGHDLVDVSGHGCGIGLAVEDEDLGAVLLLGVLLGLGGLALVEDVGEVRHEEGDLLRCAGCRLELACRRRRGRLGRFHNRRLRRFSGWHLGCGSRGSAATSRQKEAGEDYHG